MGRRALPKIDPQVPLESHLFALDEWEEGRQVVDAFPIPMPLEIEVGCGKGLFLRTAAQERPEHNFLGIEISLRYAKFAAAKLAEHDVSNAIMLHGDGAQLLRDNVLDGSLEAVHVYFPDPWWKARHRKRRVMNESFACRVVDVLRPGGALHFWTDVEEYFHVALELLARVTPLTGPIDVEEKSADHDFDYRTHYERRVRHHGKSVYRSRFLKAQL